MTVRRSPRAAPGRRERASVATVKLLVTGAGGQLGRELVLYAEAQGSDVVGADRSRLDVTDADAVADVVSSLRPDAVVNCAAWTAVDACESDPDRAYRVNGTAVVQLAAACDDIGAHLVQVSTEYVFDGTSSRPYRENDTTDPLSVYGASKRAGEHAALALGDGSTVVRTSWVCGEHGNNMVRTVLGLVDRGVPMRFVDDQHGCPTFTADLAPVLHRVAVERTGGIIHTTNTGARSWYQFVREIVAADGGDPDTISPISTAELDPPRPAQRPANGVLDGARMRELGWPPLRDVPDALADLVPRLRQQ